MSHLSSHGRDLEQGSEQVSPQRKTNRFLIGKRGGPENQETRKSEGACRDPESRKVPSVEPEVWLSLAEALGSGEYHQHIVLFSLLEKCPVEQRDLTHLIPSLSCATASQPWLSLGQLLDLQSPKGSHYPAPFSFPFASYREKDGFTFLGVMLEQ